MTSERVQLFQNQLTKGYRLHSAGEAVRILLTFCLLAYIPCFPFVWRVILAACHVYFPLHLLAMKVAVLHLALYICRFLTGPIDGIYDDTTKNAVTSYQSTSKPSLRLHIRTCPSTETSDGGILSKL